MKKNDHTYIIIAGLAAASALGGFFLVKKLKDKRAEKKNPALPNPGSNPVPASLPTGGSTTTPSTTKKTYFNPKPVADKLFNAMKGVGTDEQSIFDALEGLERGQLQQVMDAFGKPKYQSSAGVHSEWFGAPKNLRQWLRGELGGKDLEKAQEIFTQHGINL